MTDQMLQPTHKAAAHLVHRAPQANMTSPETPAAWACLRLAALCAAMALSACGRETAQSLAESGRRSSDDKKHATAIVQFKQALEKDPSLQETRYLLGQSLMESGDPVAAAVEFTKAMEQGYDREKVLPPLAEALLAIGDFKRLVNNWSNVTLQDRTAEATLKTYVSTAWTILGDSAKAEAALQAALSAKPDHGPARLLQARQLAVRGEWDRALTLVDSILAADPKLLGAWMLKGEILSQTGKESGAESAVQEALKIAPEYFPAHSAVISRRLLAGDVAGAEAQLVTMKQLLPKHLATTLAEAQLQYVKRDLPKSRELVQQVLRVETDNLSALQLSGAIEAQIGSPVLAETQFTKVLQINPELLVTRISLATTYLRLGQPAKALAVLQPALAASVGSAQAHALAAEAQLQLNKPDLAEAEFKLAATIDPKNDRLAVAVAQARLARGETAAGMAELQSISSKSKELYADLALVSLHLKRGQLDAALAAIDAMDRKRPKDASVAELRGRLLLAQQDPNAAREAFEQALKIDPQMYAATAQLSSLDIREGKTEQARQRYAASIKADPNNFYPRMALAALQRRLGEPSEKVEATLTEAISAASNAAPPRLMLIDLLLKQRRFKEAMAQANSAATALPNDTAVLEAVGRASMAAGSVEQAANTFRRLSNLMPTSASPWLLLADLYKTDGRMDAAITALKKAIEVEPTNSAAGQRLLDILVSSKREREAIEMGQEAQRAKPGEPQGYLFEAITLVRLKRLDEAVVVLRKGLKAVPNSKDLAPVMYSMLSGNGRAAEADRFAADWLKEHPADAGFDFHVSAAEMQRGEYAKAEVRLARVLATNPENALALNNKAFILLQTGKPGALPLARRAVEILPEDANSLDTLALALAGDKQFPKALEVQRRALELAPGNHNLRLTLARIAIQAGDKTLARKELQTLQELGAKFPAQSEVNKLLASL